MSSPWASASSSAAPFRPTSVAAQVILRVNIAAYGSFVFSVLLALLCLVSVICTYVLKETRQRDLEDIMLPTATLAE